MGYEFRNWLACPVCDEREGVSLLAHQTEMVLECYECGEVSEFVIGEDISLQNLDIEKIKEVAGDSMSD
ncbi:hypothetical protein [Natrinema sp. 1APR25-10V2]|uniref:hypothetical protein n=1 Tax=Natrinema sp. 1APR25-10V2 TaxID=2951081 RepID=UPI0028760664|nr:hypothetical protein [Natrinema sp. 1APR25-10V2]MDS0477978.1 hypothetical protein [Natrinema sp. 1APR25-10V2]